MAGFYACGCTVPVPPNEDFADLAGNEQAAGSQHQRGRAARDHDTSAMAKHINRRCTAEGWRNLHKEKLTLATTTFTMRCAMSSAPQRLVVSAPT